MPARNESFVCLVEGRPPVAKCIHVNDAQANKLRPTFKNAIQRNVPGVEGLAAPTGTIAVLSEYRRRRG